jgi:hypothetical protein
MMLTLALYGSLLPLVRQLDSIKQLTLMLAVNG